MKHVSYWRVWSDGLISQIDVQKLSWAQQDICVSSDTFELWYELDYTLNIYQVYSRIEEMACELDMAKNVCVHMVSTLEEHIAKRVYFDKQRVVVAKKNMYGVSQKRLL